MNESDSISTDNVSRKPSDGELWYFRIDGRQFGPASRKKLEDFLSPPRLCKSLEVKCVATNGEWLPIEADESIESVTARLDPPSHASNSGSNVPSRFRRDDAGHSSASNLELLDWLGDTWRCIRRYPSSVFEKVVYNPGHVKNVALVLCLFGTLSLLLPTIVPAEHSESQIVSTYERILNEALNQHLDDSPSEWSVFAAQSMAQLLPIIRELEKSSSAKSPFRQLLLHAGRDHLKSVLSSDRPPETSSQQLRVVEQYMDLARNSLKAS